MKINLRRNQNIGTSIESAKKINGLLKASKWRVHYCINIESSSSRVTTINGHRCAPCRREQSMLMSKTHGAPIRELIVIDKHGRIVNKAPLKFINPHACHRPCPPENIIGDWRRRRVSSSSRGEEALQLIENSSYRNQRIRNFSLPNPRITDTNS